MGQPSKVGAIMKDLYEAPLGRGQRATDIAIWMMVTVAVVAAVVALHTQQFWDPEHWKVLLNPDVLHLLYNGALKTLLVAVVSLGISILVAVQLGRWSFARRRLLRSVVVTYVELFRGLPLLLLIFFLYLGLPAVGVDISTFWALTLGVSLFTSANLADILRGGVEALGKGQREAAESLGLLDRQTYFLVLLPQAARIMLPSAVAQLVILVKETSLGFIIGYTELLRNGRSAVEFLGSSYAPAIYTGVALFYLVINAALTLLAHRAGRQPHARRRQSTPTSSTEGSNHEVQLQS